MKVNQFYVICSREIQQYELGSTSPIRIVFLLKTLREKWERFIYFIILYQLCCG